MDEAQQPEFRSFFPQPPPFWKNFTAENLERLSQFKKDAIDSVGETGGETTTDQLSAAKLLELPSELRYLIPPEPPAEEDEYRVFNGITKAHAADNTQRAIELLKNELDVERGDTRFQILPGWEFEQLYPTHPDDGSGNAANWSYDRQRYLMRFVNSILLNFLELVSIMYTDPASEQRLEKLKDMVTLVANVHALLNEYRPHQARETLVLQMKDQVERKRAEVAAVKQMKDKVAAALAEFEKNAPDQSGSAPSDDDGAISPEEKMKTAQRHMWNAMEELLGH